MRLGIIGMGVVGSANSTGFEYLRHKVFQHDLKFDTNIYNVSNTDVVFLCLPTPAVEGACETTIIETIIKELVEINYKGIICIRSTVEPGFTEGMINKYPNMSICCAPEFLRERAAEDDFINNHRLLAVGTDDPYIFKKIVEAHGHLPKVIKQLTPTEAEILKYFNNSYAALRIVFANIFFELCEKFDCDYSQVKDAYVHTGKTKNIYLDVNKNLRGYGGMCLPKDVEALVHTLRKNDLYFNLIDSVKQDNEKFKTTVFKGMRSEDLH